MGPPIRADVERATFKLSWENARDVAVTPTGDFVVAWPTPYAAGVDIAARRFDGAGMPTSAEFIVNTNRVGQQTNQTVASDDAGKFVVVWQSDAPPDYGILGQRYDATASPLGGEFRIDNASAGHHPFVAVRPTGEFAVTWTSGYGVMARLYDASGSPASPEIPVTTSSATDWRATPSLDLDAAGNVVVAWREPRPNFPSHQLIKARLFASTGIPQGAEFLVNTGAGGTLYHRVARARSGSFVIAWFEIDAGLVFARRFDASGAPVGAELVVSPAYAIASSVDVDMDDAGDFVVVWEENYRIFGRRFSSLGAAGPAFAVNHLSVNARPSISSQPGGNFVVAWRSELQRAGWTGTVYARRYAVGLVPAGIVVDPTPGPGSDGNGVFEPGETVTVAPSWSNATFAPEAFDGTAATFSGPGPAGNPDYTVADGTASYGTVPANTIASCATASDCYALRISTPTTRPAAHWDASLYEVLSPASPAVSNTWTLHVGDSFGDVARANPFYRFIETMLHAGVTTGCGAGLFCPAAPTTREQMAVFVLLAREGAGYAPRACATSIFGDVPPSSPYCPWIEELARRGVVSGCGGGNYCPGAPVSREQMAVFVLRTRDEGLSEFTMGACTSPTLFADVPASSPFCPWIEELARRNVVAGCGGGNYCPAESVTREQMAVFISAGFGLQLYGP